LFLGEMGDSATFSFFGDCFSFSASSFLGVVGSAGADDVVVDGVEEAESGGEAEGLTEPRTSLVFSGEVTSFFSFFSFSSFFLSSFSSFSPSSLQF